VITVMLVDDHQLVRAGLAALLDAADDLDVVAEAADGLEALELARAHRPAVVLMDLSMPIMDGVQATRQLMTELPETYVVVLTSFADRDRVAEALSSGAIGYLLKDCDPHELLSAVRAAAKGLTPLDPRVAGALLPKVVTVQPQVEAAAVPSLSVREREVLALVSNGLPNKQIGRQLGISERTVKVHLGNIFRRIGVGDRTSAALWARENLTGPNA
jgi:DNA-binding NarL/FixJ family response regulator